MRLLLALALCCTPLTSLHAQEAPEQATAPQTQPQSKPAPRPPIGRITGTVFCADTHRPARGAIIMLYSKPVEKGSNTHDNTARVAMDGSYSFDHLAPSEYAVVAMLPGYLNPFDGVMLNPDESERIRAELWKRESAHGTVTVSNDNTTRFDIELQPGAVISGRVLYSDGAPATQISIAVENIDARPEQDSQQKNFFDLGAMTRSSLTQSSSTDDEGHFRISGIHPGTYRIVAIHPSTTFSFGDRQAMGAIDPQALLLYSGDTLHKKSAKTYDLRAGETVAGIEITIPTNVFHRVEGRLSANDGRPLSTATLTLTDVGDDTLIFLQFLDQGGVFSFPAVPTGIYNLSITKASIGVMPPGSPENTVPNPLWMKATNAFADTTTAVIVKEADLNDVNISLKEVPLPPDAAQPMSQPNQPEPPTQTIRPQ
jgi:hypothetical protein